MTARVVIPTAAGGLVSYDLAAHYGGRGEPDLRIVFSTSEEPFQRWLFYLLRELGGHVVTDDVPRFRRALGLAESETGVQEESQAAEPLRNRNPATP